MLTRCLAEYNPQVTESLYTAKHSTEHLALLPVAYLAHRPRTWYPLQA